MNFYIERAFSIYTQIWRTVLVLLWQSFLFSTILFVPRLIISILYDRYKNSILSCFIVYTRDCHTVNSIGLYRHSVKQVTKPAKSSLKYYGWWLRTVSIVLFKVQARTANTFTMTFLNKLPERSRALENSSWPVEKTVVYNYLLIAHDPVDTAIMTVRALHFRQRMK